MEIAEAYVTLLPSAKGFGRGIQGAIGGDLTKAGKQGGRVFGTGMSASLAGMAGKVFAPLAAAMAGVKVFEWFKEGVAGASDLNEAASAVGVTFGKGASQVTAFAKNAATDLGQTQVQALGAAKTFGTFGKAAGLTGGKLATFSTDMVTLASDLASFNNTSPEQAIEAIGAALRGESEPIRSYGVLLDDASMRQQALAMGLIKTTKQALTPQQKVLAAQALIYKQTADAQGDFRRTSGGLANQQRILSAQWSELKTTLGAAFLPAVTAVATRLNTALGPAIKAAGPLAQKLSGFFSDLFTNMGKGKGALTPLISAFQKFGSTVGPALASLAGPIRDFVSTLIPVFKKIGENIVGVLAPAFQRIGDLIATKFVPAVKAILPVIQPVAKFLIETLGGAVTGALSGAMKVIEGVITAVSGLLQFIANIFQGKWSAAWAGIKDVFSGVLKAILGAAQVWMNVGILKVFRLGMTALKGLWSKGLGLLKTGASAAWSGIKSLFVSALRGIGTGIVSAVKGYLGLWRGLFSSIVSILRNGWAVARSAFGGALAAIRTVITQAVSAYIGFWRGLFTKMVGAARSGIGSVRDVFTTLKAKLLSALSGAGSWLKDVGRRIVEGLWNGISGGWGWLTDKVRGLVNSLVDTAKNALGIASPSKVFHSIGANVVAGLVRGLDDRKHLVKKATQKVIDQMNSAMADARQAIKDFRQQGRDMGATIARSLGVFGENVTDYLSGLTESATTTTADSMLANMRASLTAINKWRASLSAVAKRGLPNTIVEELRSMGLDSADELAALNSMTDAQLKEWVALWRKREASGAAEGAKQFVDDIKDVVSGVQGQFESIAKNAMKGLSKGLRDEGKHVKKRLQELMDDIVKDAKKALGIKSPSRVFAGIGEQMGAGMVVGMDSSARDVARSVRRVTDAAQAAVGASSRMTLLSDAQRGRDGSGVAIYGPVTTTDVDAMARKIVSRQRDALVLVGALGV